MTDFPFTCNHPSAGFAIVGTDSTLGCCSAISVFRGSDTVPATPNGPEGTAKVGLPYVYANNLCCYNGGSPTIFDPSFQNCCGIGSYDNPNPGIIFSSSVERADLYTYTVSGCCQNPQAEGDMPVVYDFGVQGCCGGDALGRGGTIFDIGPQICCDGTIYELAALEDMDMVCCEDTLVEADLCCNGEIIDLEEVACCDIETCTEGQEIVPLEEDRRLGAARRILRNHKSSKGTSSKGKSSDVCDAKGKGKGSRGGSKGTKSETSD